VVKLGFEIRIYAFRGSAPLLLIVATCALTVVWGPKGEGLSSLLKPHGERMIAKAKLRVLLCNHDQGPSYHVSAATASNKQHK
jgi:hypothetical protein